MSADAFGNQRENMSNSMADNSVNEDYFKDKVSGK
jgi:hypothetical protein